MSTITDIAKAVVKELNEAEFTTKFKAVYSVKPGFELSELEQIRVVVVPKSLEIDRISRSSMKYTISIDVGIMRRLGIQTPEDAVENLGELVDEIADFLTDATLSQFEVATLAGITNDPIYIPEHLTSNRTFVSVLTVKYMLTG